MDDKSRLQLNKMIKANNVEDVTEDIRTKRHSEKIHADVTTMVRLKRDFARTARSTPNVFESMLVKHCNFLFTNYPDLFNKLKKDELDLAILAQFLSILKKIEDGELDQHAGAYEVGKVLKSLYIDSALKKADNLDAKHTKRPRKTAAPKKTHNISWSQYKAMQDSNAE